MEKERTIRNINSQLPPHIIHLIFSKLPFFNLPTCRLVCKVWNNLILTSKFVPPIQSSLFAHIYSHDRLHCIDFDSKHLNGMTMNIAASFSLHPSDSDLYFIGSCNGLLCFAKEITTHKAKPCVVVLNPMTNECMKLPTSDEHEDGDVSYGYGFGFRPETKQYKIARLSFVLERQELLVEFFAFGTDPGKWTRVHCLHSFFIGGPGVYFNGAFYWYGFHRQVAEHPAIGWIDRDVMCRFDVEDGKFVEIYLPQVEEDEEYDFFEAVVFNGALHLSRYHFERLEFHVWRMEQDSWTVAFVVAIPENLIPLVGLRTDDLRLVKVCEDGKILCFFDGLDFILYDPITRIVETLDRVLEIDEQLSICQIESFNFDPLHKILAGDRGLEDYVDQLTSQLNLSQEIVTIVSVNLESRFF